MDTAEKTRLPGVFPFPFCVPSSSPSSVFPSLPMFPPGFQQLYANLVQQQFLQLAQQQQSPGIRADQSPCLSDRASSREDSPSVKSESISILFFCLDGLSLLQQLTYRTMEDGRDAVIND
ncbi:hypothetical protein NECAME_11748 [Necator americanus]|uniref:Uncharacterized protein n=1 Tax=Necator americanus TaxID=51031 RepID=W2T5B3_NECAM|nr:hypothetical protein NECAME_11748 [Necator americanus]ETN76366.1 hypothetical protein NECAME_11748 [Necator americanus]